MSQVRNFGSGSLVHFSSVIVRLKLLQEGFPHIRSWATAQHRFVLDAGWIRPSPSEYQSWLALDEHVVTTSSDPACTVVMLTSLVNRQTVEECLHLGAVGYLRKDNPPDEMTAQLKKIINDCFGAKQAPIAQPPDHAAA